MSRVTASQGSTNDSLGLFLVPYPKTPLPNCKQKLPSPSPSLLPSPLPPPPPRSAKKGLMTRTCVWLIREISSFSRVKGWAICYREQHILSPSGLENTRELFRSTRMKEVRLNKGNSLLWKVFLGQIRQLKSRLFIDPRPQKIRC